MSNLDELCGLDVPRDLFVGGEWARGAAAQTFAVIDPATEQELATVASADAADGLAAVAAAHDALPGWAATPPRVRGEVLRRAFELMTARAEQLARLVVLENGKVLADARAEVAYAAEFFRWYSEEAVRASGQLGWAPSGQNRIAVLHQPVGVCVLVTPWNFPAAMATRKLGPALAAGNSVVLKPASATPLTALVLIGLLHEAGVPPGVVNVVPSRSSGSVVSAMLHDDRVRKLSFTGSTEVGRLLLHQAADQVVNCSMELGGNAPFVVFEDADIDAAVAGAMVAKMRNGGEACTAANRLYVHDSVVEKFADAFASAMAAVVVGNGLDEDSQLGPLVDDEARTKVHELVASAVDAGGRVLTGGTVLDRAGYFYPPTVVADVPADTAILREEIFGPVAPIVAFSDEDEVVERANASEHGLVAYVFTGDLARGLRVSERIESGMIGLNRGLVSDPAAPFGGVKQSGLGREGGHEGMLDYLEPKYIATTW